MAYPLHRVDRGAPGIALGEGRWVRERPGSQEQEAGIALIAMQDRERSRFVEEIYAAR